MSGKQGCQYLYAPDITPYLPLHDCTQTGGTPPERC